MQHGKINYRKICDRRETAMDVAYLRRLLQQVADQETDIDKALEELKHLPYEDIGYANIDQHRNLRTGQGEVIFGQGKTPEQIAGIVTPYAERQPENPDHKSG